MKKTPDSGGTYSLTWDPNHIEEELWGGNMNGGDSREVTGEQQCKEKVSLVGQGGHVFRVVSEPQ